MATAPTTGEAPQTAPAGHENTAVAGHDGTTSSGDNRAAPAGHENTAEGAQDRWARIARWARRSARAILTSAQSSVRSAWEARSRRRIRLIDVLRVLGLARRAVPRPVVGPKAYPQWWQRIVALLVLAAMVVGIGFVVAALVGFLVVVAGFLLEQAIS